jgi:preprotein translocase subunit SecA
MVRSDRLPTFETLVAQAGEFRSQMERRTDEELRGLTGTFRGRLADGELLDSLILEASAAVSEAGRRGIGQPHTDRQLMAGLALHNGSVAEMKDGEGKSIAATLPAYLNALSGKGTHIATLTDELARRDARRAARIFDLLGLRVGLAVSTDAADERKKAYDADVTYASYLQFGHDYLCDNVAWDLDDCMQRGHHFVIVDEADSILLDQARTPMSLSSPEQPILARVTVREYYRMYEKLAGLTATAMPAVREFDEIYHLDVVQIPTLHPVTRIDHPDALYETAKAKFESLARVVASHHTAGQPVVIGTATAEACDQVIAMLEKAEVAYEILRPGREQSADVIMRRAGQPGAVTVLWSPVGRGHCIPIGGDVSLLAGAVLDVGSGDSAHVVPQERLDDLHTATDAARTVAAAREQVIKAGGLVVLGAERSLSQRADDWLRGLAGQCGEPGEARFFISADDLLLLQTDSGFRKAIPMRLRTLGEGRPAGPIADKTLKWLIDRIQRNAEESSFQYRRKTFVVDEVDDRQRRKVYAMRREIIKGRDLRERVRRMIDEVIDRSVASAADVTSRRVDLERVMAGLKYLYPVSLTTADLLEISKRETLVPLLTELIRADAHRIYNRREQEHGSEVMRQFERQVMLYVMDREWCQYLVDADVLYERITERSNSVDRITDQYRRENPKLYDVMLDRAAQESVRYLYYSQIPRE